MFLRTKMLKKPKVAFIHPAIGETVGGSQIFVMELAERLKDRCDITIFSAKQQNELCKSVFSIPRRNETNKNNPFYNFAYNK